ncbi:MAG: 50S ribosomal protein L18 [Nanoarchaeota archaeon]|nr:50S ribosomal protein L18 [Nanoarchaeota archaeon]MBU1644472.1 50S ribosomal protein L18 [Nanoarchaeota archaeon]MBU1976476.1 50S ribosomal protein L18 [Nanoarchaeota archaeon]
MATRKPKTVPYRRKREQKTVYSKRLKLLLPRKERLVVRLTNQKVIAQVVQFTTAGDKVLLGVDSSALKKLGWNYSLKNTSAVYLTGLLFGKEALKKGHSEMIFDTGLKSPLHKGKLFAFLKGVVDAGVEIPHGNDEIFPGEERIRGAHVKEYAELLKKEKSAYEERFTKYLKNKTEPEKIEKVFDEVKEKINNQ